MSSVKERIPAFLRDVAQLGVDEALYYQNLAGRYPEVQVLDPTGTVLIKGLLFEFDTEYFTVIERATHGYVHQIEPTGKEIRVVTTDGREMTPGLFKQLVEGKAGKGYLEKLEARARDLARLAGIPLKER